MSSTETPQEPRLVCRRDFLTGQLAFRIEAVAIRTTRYERPLCQWKLELSDLLYPIDWLIELAAHGILEEWKEEPKKQAPIVTANEEMVKELTKKPGD